MKGTKKKKEKWVSECERARTDGKKNYYLYMCAQQRRKNFIESLFLRLYVRIRISTKLKEYFYRGLCNFFLFLTHSLSVYPLGTNNISLTGFSFGIWNENLQKLWNIYIFSDRTCAYPFYFPHPFLHVLSAFFPRCYVLYWNHLWLTRKLWVAIS